MKIEKIEWRDSYGLESPWLEQQDVFIDNPVVITIGVVVAENKDYLVVANSMSPESNSTSEQNSGRMFVYKKCILKRTKIGEI